MIQGQRWQALIHPTYLCIRSVAVCTSIAMFIILKAQNDLIKKRLEWYAVMSVYFYYSTLCYRKQSSTFSYTRQSTSLLEKVAVCVARQEPVLLVGETGTGKTTSVQYLAEQLGWLLYKTIIDQFGLTGGQSFGGGQTS